jgi:hypothetical protein
MVTLLALIVILAIVCGGFGYARNDYALPGVSFGTILLILIVLWMMGRL